jgi:hypothetical protein
MNVTIEYGPSQKFNPFSDVVPRAYGTSILSPLTGKPHVLDQVSGVSGLGVDKLGLSVFSEINSYLGSHHTCYCSFNSNSVIAAGLLMMGYSQKEVGDMVKGVGAGGLSPVIEGATLAKMIQNAIDPNSGFSLQFEDDSVEATDFEHWGETWL